MAVRRLILALAMACLAAPALAGQPVTLKAETTDADGLVTLSDLFDGSGAAGKIPVAARAGSTITLDALAVQSLARRSGLDWPNAEGVRRIAVRAAGQATAAAPRGNVEVLTYARSLATGEMVQAQDVIWAKAAAAPADAAVDAEAVIGLAARRPLRAGAAVMTRDVAALPVIRQGELVTLVYEDGGISLTLQGKAMAAAGLGEVVNVQNLASKKIVQAVASGPGQAMVGPGAARLTTGLVTGPARFARR